MSSIPSSSKCLLSSMPGMLSNWIITKDFPTNLIARWLTWLIVLSSIFFAGTNEPLFNSSRNFSPSWENDVKEHISKQINSRAGFNLINRIVVYKNRIINGKILVRNGFQTKNRLYRCFSLCKTITVKTR